LSGSYAGSRTETTTHLPSGLTTGVPTRFIIHSSSCVIGVPAAASAVTSGRLAIAARAAVAISCSFITFRATAIIQDKVQYD
jgi:hypothetical protein